MSKARTLSDKATAGRKNVIINGNFDIWQRGNSLTDVSNNTYLADRWAWIGNLQVNGGQVDLIREIFDLGQTDVPNEPEFFTRINHASIGTGTASNYRQKIEDVRTLSGKTATLSFYAKADSNKTLSVNTTQNFGTGGTPSAVVGTDIINASVTTSWQKFVMTFDIPSISGKTLGTDGNDFLQVNFGLPIETGTLDIAQVQLEKGSVATDFEQRPIGEELALCQRYYVAQGMNGLVGSVRLATAINFGVDLPVVMRASPTGELSSTSPEAIIGTGFATASGATVGVSSGDNRTFRVFINGWSGLSANAVMCNFAGFVYLDAEL